MSKAPLNSSATVAQRNREVRDKRLAKRRDNPQFMEHMKGLRGRIGTGQSLAEAREYMEIENDQYWEDLVTMLSLAFVNPANIMLEWQVRQSARYKMTMELVGIAKSHQDKGEQFEYMSRAIMIAAKLDEQTLELQKALGLIQPVEGDEIGGHGISSEDIAIAEQRFNTIVEQSITSKLRAEREAQSSESVTLLPRLESGGEENRVELAPLVENTVNGPESGHPNPQGITNGSEHVLPSEVVLDVQNQNNA